MNWEFVALLLYLVIGVGCVLVGEIWSRKYPEGRSELTLLGFFLITVLWPVFLIGVALEEFFSRRRG